MAQDLQAGKASFESGYYQEAFRQLLPLAVKCKAEAQYAVGYMYYYGYGVTEDAESGIFWMTQAAAQNYPPAIRAIQLLRHPTAESQSIIPMRQPSPYETHRNEIMHRMEQRLEYEPLIFPKKKQISFVQPEELPSEPPIKIASSAEEKQDFSGPLQTSRQYALQLYGSYHLDDVKDLQSQLRLRNTGHIYQTKHEGKDWFVLTFGSFVTSREASATETNLPKELRKMHPWVRNVNELRMV